MTATVTEKLSVYVDGEYRQLAAKESSTPGLYVVKLPKRFDGSSYLRWRIVHHSGRQIAAARTETRVTDAAAWMATVTDWTRTPGEILADHASRTLDAKQMYADLYNRFDVWHNVMH